MPGSPEECLSARCELVNGLLNELGCRTPIGGRLIGADEDRPAAVVGQMGQPQLEARLSLSVVGRWIGLRESWDFEPEIQKLIRTAYWYGLYDKDPDTSDPAFRFERHPFGGGRAGKTYGEAGFEHFHADGPFTERAHVPTGPVSLEAFIRFSLVEGSDLDDEAASELVSASRDAEKNARDWTDLF